MGFCQSHLMLSLLIFFWTTGCHVLHGLNTQEENNIGSTFFFYQQSTYPRNCREIQEKCSSDNSTGVFMIKPDGYLEPFEVYCDSTDDSGGWTVIQRRIDGSIGFNRSWESYESGFGFLSQEFWIGNEKLSFLTNQDKYQLVIEMTTVSGSLVRLVYDNFKISDGFSDYKLVNLGQYSGSTDAITFCGTNMICGNCENACQRTCESPDDCNNVDCTETMACVCPDGFFLKGSDCVPPDSCECYDTMDQIIIPEGGFYVNPGCTRKGNCFSQQISFDEQYRCSPHAMCEARGSIRQCYCNDDYTGDGEICMQNVTYKDCQEIYEEVSMDSGVYRIKPTDWPGSPFEVYCNMTNGVGWTVFQRRVDGTEDFDVGWSSYKQGFGNISHEFWLGNDKIHFLTNQKTYEIRIDLVNVDDDAYHANFDSFRINNESDNYRLIEIGTYSGTADERTSPSCSVYQCLINLEFTTNDDDNDGWSSGNCAADIGGAGWYDNCGCCCGPTCNYGWYLNGRYGTGGFGWLHLPGSIFLQWSEMKIRPI